MYNNGANVKLAVEVVDSDKAPLYAVSQKQRATYKATSLQEAIDLENQDAMPEEDQARLGKQLLPRRLPMDYIALLSQVYSTLFIEVDNLIPNVTDEEIKKLFE